MTSKGSQAQRLRHARAVLAQAESQQRVSEVSTNLYADKGVNRGVYHLDGTVEGVALGISQTVEDNQFIAVVGIEDLSWEGVEALGVDVSRIALIREVGDQGLKVVGSLLEGFSLVVLGPIPLAPRHQRALAARARTLGATILTVTPWVGVSTALPSLSSNEGEITNPLLRYRREQEVS